VSDDEMHYYLDSESLKIIVLAGFYFLGFSAKADPKKTSQILNTQRDSYLYFAEPIHLTSGLSRAVSRIGIVEDSRRIQRGMNFRRGIFAPDD